MEADESVSEAVEPRARRSGRRPHFLRVPRAAESVRSLLETASEEEREKAHRLVTGILEWWLGQRRKEEVATALGVSGLRLWQLSQRATAGMVAGLLRQPLIGVRGRPRMEEKKELEELKKENARLRREKDDLERLLDLLKSLPASARRGTEEGSSPSPRKKKERPSPKKGARAGRSLPPAVEKDPGQDSPATRE
jgi:hypothetical protein